MQLREVARKLFVKTGFDRTSMDSVAKAAGVSKRTPYIYFENKHDLFSAVILEFLTEMETLLCAAWKVGQDQCEIETAVKIYARYALADPARFELLMTFERQDFYPGRQRQALSGHAAACQAINDRITENLVDAIKRAKASTKLKTPMNAKQFGLLLWSALTGVLTFTLERESILEDTYDWTGQEIIDAFIVRFLPHTRKGDNL